MFHEDNAPCHRSISTMAKLHELHFHLLSHSSTHRFVRFGSQPVRRIQNNALRRDIWIKLIGYRRNSGLNINPSTRKASKCYNCWNDCIAIEWIKSNFHKKLLFPCDPTDFQSMSCVPLFRKFCVLFSVVSPFGCKKMSFIFVVH